jgi:hypothetical protein
MDARKGQLTTGGSLYEPFSSKRLVAEVARLLAKQGGPAHILLAQCWHSVYHRAIGCAATTEGRGSRDVDHG